ncbi:MAG: hypothetical protein ACXU8U_11495 [Asticcacaulis sp.]
MNPRLRNMLMSVGLCVALIGAYYVIIGNETVPDDTHIVFTQAGCSGACPLHRIDITADGAARIVEPGAAALSRRLGRPALRQVLRGFRRENFLDLDVAKFSAIGDEDVCTLGLTLDHRKTVIRYGCLHPPIQASQPLAVMARVLKAARPG